MFIYKLYIKDFMKFHIGKNEINNRLDNFHSDTLFSAIVNCYLLLYGNNSINNFINHFLNREILISSAFYFIDIYKDRNYKNTICFFPNPYFKLSNSSEAEYIANVKYISLELFTELTANFNLESKMSRPDSHVNLLSDDFCTTEGEFQGEARLNFKQMIIEPKASINFNRLYKENIRNYSEVNILINNQIINNLTLIPGIFFLANFQPDPLKTKEYIERFDSTISLLCDEGLGGRRASGKGQFSYFRKDEFKYDTYTLSNAQCKINLSLISPGASESKHLKDNLIRYTSIIRSGWAPNNVKLKNIRMIGEGSLFANKIKGRLVNISPENFKEHKIYRNGIGFYL